MHTYSITVTEEERQMILLALAELALERPGWNYSLSEMASKFAGIEMFEEFKRLNADHVRPLPSLRYGDQP